MTCKSTEPLKHVLVEILVPVYINPNKELKGKCFVGISVTPKVSQVLSELTVNVNVKKEW
jgi:hypothetical protein